jgi:hypothetical protein
MKNVKNRARPISTWDGGVCLVPRAFLKNENTTIILVKDVKSISILGASARTVMIKRISSVVTKSRSFPTGEISMPIDGKGNSSCG